MERLAADPGFTRRQNISAAVLVVVTIYGFFELWLAFGSGTGDQTSAMFGVLFVGGGLYGGKTIWDEGRDLVVALDADQETARITLWRPFRNRVLDVPVAGLKGWLYRVKLAKRNAKLHYLVFEAPGYPQPLRIEMRPGAAVPEGLRRLAGSAIDDYEAGTGARPDADG